MRMDKPKVDLSRTELDFLKRLLLDLQQNWGRAASQRRELVRPSSCRWPCCNGTGKEPPPLDAQVGLGAAIQLKLGPMRCMRSRSGAPSAAAADLGALTIP
jgi:hypothetical protein